MSSICKSFESNAWRSDLCSHCFQSKEEHDLLLQPMTSSDPTKDVASSALPSSSTGLGSRYQSVLNHCRSSYRTGSTTTAAATIGSLTPVVTATTSAATKTTTGPTTTTSVMNPSTRSSSGVKAILKTNGNSAPTRTKHSKSVNFPDGDDDAHVQVIGYGGQECFDDDTDDDETDHRNSKNDDDDDDDVPFTEEERMIHNQTQKNTSFNSVSRNLLASEVATFKNHGVSSTRVTSSSTSAPLVTIRPFGQSAPSLNSAARTKSNGATSDCPKINLVSPMRNGQVLTAGIARSTAVTNQTNNKEQMKNRENLLKKSEQLIDNVVQKPEVEKITSFSDPVPAVITNETAVEEQPLPTPPASPTPTAPPDVSSNTKHIVLQSSRVASGRIESDSSKPASNRSTLTRKPPVWREKPRIPIKPQTGGAPPPAGVAESTVVASHPADKVSTSESKSPQPQMKLQSAECQPGQISIRFVHLSSGGDDTVHEAPPNLPSLIPANLNDSPIPQKCQVVKQLSALERLDLLGSSENLTEILPSACVALPQPSPSPKVAEVETISPNFVLENLAEAEVVTPPRTPSPITMANEINNNPIKAVLAEQEDQVQTHPDAQPTPLSKSPRLTNKSDEAKEEATKTDSFSVDCRSNSTRGLTRSAFEALRANLAGSLELSRVCQPQRGINGGNPKRQAPPTPLSCDTENSASQSDSGPSSPPSSLASLNMADPVAPLPPPAQSPPSPPPAPALPSLIECVVTTPAKQSPPTSAEKIRPSDRAISASPRFRNSLICTSPDGGSMAVDEEDGHPRSVSLTRVERSDSQSMATKPPSIRKFIKERATHFLHMADAGGSCGGGSSRPSGSRLSRSDRFAAESRATVNGKKGKSRFSLRKFLGLKKDGGWDEPAEPLPPKIRPEIVHPIDFHPIGQVQVVQGKVQNNSNDSVIGRSPAHDSISSSDSGRHSSMEMQQSDSSLGSSDCPSPANSHQSNSFKSASLKGRPKPPPPPRLHSLDQPLVVAAPQRSNTSTPTNRPSRPPPPKSSDPMSHDVSRFSPSQVHNSRPNAAEYANLGDIRNGMTPKKPERSASMRTRERSTTYDSHALESKQDGLHYDCVSIQQPSPVNKPTADEDGYIIPMRMKSSPSFSSVSSSSASSGQRHSLTSFQPTQEGPPSRRCNRLSGMRQSRQDLHVKLEDHYGTVTGANFQALAQLLEQATSKRPLAPHFHELRRVKSQDLKWNVFEDHCVLLRTASVTFMQSTWQNHDLLLSVFNDSLLEMAENKAPFAQPAVVTFTAHVPAPLLPARGIKTAGIEVFPPGQVAMLKQLPHLLTMETEGQMERLQQSLSILLQICRAMEWLSQQKRVVDRLNHEEIVFYREHSQDAYRLLWLPQEAESGLGLSVKETLSSCIRLLTPLLSNQLADKLFVILQRDVMSVDRMCQFLEYTMFGPSADLIDGDHDQSDLDMFQRWLDVERASTLNELIRTQGLWRVKLSVVEEFRLSFLISTSPHHLFDTSQI
ncbi:platelet binding protein GspB [Daphnia magna]|uniref:platelet binding protein GspB n=1 Tax=Daphnia magna TaxID=35525 RepID=UPI001E1BD18F|nr:platelet binding protein GspB [Daphnia magna]